VFWSEIFSSAEHRQMLRARGSDYQSGYMRIRKTEESKITSLRQQQ
jgi:hypothetical protein